MLRDDVAAGGSPASPQTGEPPVATIGLSYIEFSSDVTALS